MLSDRHYSLYMKTTAQPVTILRKVPVFPSATLVNGLPTVCGVSYYTWADAIQAKRRNVEYIWIDLFGCQQNEPITY